MSKKESRLVSEKMAFVADLSRTHSWISNRYTTFLKPFGISPPQLNILRVLRKEADWLTMHSINELLIVKSPNVTRLTDKLVGKDLVVRKRSEEDRRVVYVKITEAGLDLLARFDEAHEGELSEYMDSFTAEEAVMMTEILNKIRS